MWCENVKPVYRAPTNSLCYPESINETGKNKHLEQYFSTQHSFQNLVCRMNTKGKNVQPEAHKSQKSIPEETYWWSCL